MPYTAYASKGSQFQSSNYRSAIFGGFKYCTEEVDIMLKLHLCSAYNDTPT